jgi:hypothetical protein
MLRIFLSPVSIFVSVPALSTERLPAAGRVTSTWLEPGGVTSEECPKLIECLGSAPRDEDKIEQIAEFPGDDPLQGAGYGLDHIVDRPGVKSHDDVLREG